jgi:hypothetical protein
VSGDLGGKKYYPTKVEGQGVLPFGQGWRAAILHNKSYNDSFGFVRLVFERLLL